MTLPVSHHGMPIPGLGQAEITTLVALARDSLYWLTGGHQHDFSFSRYVMTPELEEPRATFVTLLAHGQLRGCIGNLDAREALYRSVHANTVQAAAHDPRFEPVRAEEVPGLDVHVSILSRPEPIASLEDFRVGADGIILTRGTARAVFLPDVAAEQGWSREETAEQLCRKAGLPAGAWREGAAFSTFTAFVICGNC